MSTDTTAKDVIVKVEDDRTGMSPETLRRAVLDHLRFSRAKTLSHAHLLDIYHAVSLMVRDRLVHRWITTAKTYNDTDARRIYYLSAEYLLGRQLEKNLLNLGLVDMARAELARYGVRLQDVYEREADPGLGNGGLGRLAACFMDSLATLELPAMGYGIRYEFGIFRQQIRDGWQVEQPDEWLRNGNPWEIRRHEYTATVRFGGRVEQSLDAEGNMRFVWVGGETVNGVPFDTPIAGFGTATVNTLRLWSARASEQFDLAVFNDGDFRRATEQKAVSESISKILYPRDDSAEGKELRLRQQYFFVCCSLQDILRRYKRYHDDPTLSGMPDKVVVQLNDTHPSIAVAEMMRLLVDREGLGWEDAWERTRAMIAYTNHTLLPEALERWSLPLFRRLLPRHLQIIYEINRRFLRQVHLYAPNDADLKSRLSIIEESDPKQIRMANLSVVGSRMVNGVAQLHSKLLRERVLKDFADMYPERFTNKTNGVTPRRWLMQANPRLRALITEAIGDGWITDLDQLQALAPQANDAAFLDAVRDIKQQNKIRWQRWLARKTGQLVNPEMIFDVHIKRIHEYKRQLMVCLHTIHLYRRIKFLGEDIVPRTVMIGGKAAPGYARAKKTIKIINDVANTINSDPDVQGKLQLYFLPNYNVSMTEKLIPASDLSEQVSMAGKEASGTGNMKFQMNGALTVGTLDGANIEIRDAVGPENFFLFGLNAMEIRELQANHYVPNEWLNRSPALKETVDLLDSSFFNPDDRWVHKEMARYIREDDPYCICADFESYMEIQERAAETWTQPETWWPMVVRNIANSGRFSSDRTIREYAEEIWNLPPVKVSMKTEE
ncbi:MAG: glycogen/starch/alpha-glucan phosphorylase [Myxococcota bacterium]